MKIKKLVSNYSSSEDSIVLLHKNKRILLCTGNMLYDINLQIGFRVSTVFGVGGVDGRGSEKSSLHNRDDHAI